MARRFRFALANRNVQKANRLANSGNYDEALGLLLEAVRLDPAFTEAHRALTEIYVVREDYRVGVPEPGFYREIMNTDAGKYGGTNVGNLGGVHAEAVPWNNRTHSIHLRLPPLAAVYFKYERW